MLLLVITHCSIHAKRWSVLYVSLNPCIMHPVSCMRYVCMNHKNESANKHLLTLLHLPLQLLFDAAVYWERFRVGHKYFMNGFLNTWRFLNTWQINLFSALLCWIDQCLLLQLIGLKKKSFSYRGVVRAVICRMGVRSLDKRSEAPSTCSRMIHTQFHVNIECNMIYDGFAFLEFHTDILIAGKETRIHFNRKSLCMTYPSVSRSDMV